MASDHAHKHFIVTIRKVADSAPIAFYVLGQDAAQAKARAKRLAKATEQEILSVLSA